MDEEDPGYSSSQGNTGVSGETRVMRSGGNVRIGMIQSEAEATVDFLVGSDVSSG